MLPPRVNVAGLDMRTSRDHPVNQEYLPGENAQECGQNKIEQDPYTDTKRPHHETVEEQKVTTAFFPVGESEVELLESTSPDGPVAKFIEKKGQGFQHVAFRVANIEEALEELKAKDIQLIDQQPRIGAGGAKIAFIHPKATGGILVELCERS